LKLNFQYRKEVISWKFLPESLLGSIKGCDAIEPQGKTHSALV
jgi:hypothetical protein